MAFLSSEIFPSPFIFVFFYLLNLMNTKRVNKFSITEMAIEHCPQRQKLFLLISAFKVISYIKQIKQIILFSYKGKSWQIFKTLVLLLITQLRSYPQEPGTRPKVLRFPYSGECVEQSFFA